VLLFNQISKKLNHPAYMHIKERLIMQMAMRAIFILILIAMPQYFSYARQVDPIDSNYDSDDLQNKSYQEQIDSNYKYKNVKNKNKITKKSLLNEDIYNMIDDQFNSLEKQVRDLTGQIEKINFIVAQLSDKINRIQTDNDLRFKELESKSGGVVKSVENITALVGKTPKEFYDYAVGLVNSDKAAANKAFQTLIMQYPKDLLVGNAMYWMAQILYSEDQYEQAAVKFYDVYQNYSKSTKAGESLLKVGLSLSKLNKKKEACDAISKFSTKFPNAEESLRKLAVDEKKKLGC
jgi:tol-pal system protein YbgF